MSQEHSLLFGSSSKKLQAPVTVEERQLYLSDDQGVLAVERWPDTTSVPLDRSLQRRYAAMLALQMRQHVMAEDLRDVANGAQGSGGQASWGRLDSDTRFYAYDHDATLVVHMTLARECCCHCGTLGWVTGVPAWIMETV